MALDPVTPEESAAISFFLAMDAPEHTRYRGLVSAAFTPRAVASVADRIQRDAASIVDGPIGAGDIALPPRRRGEDPAPRDHRPTPDPAPDHRVRRAGAAGEQLHPRRREAPRPSLTAPD